jgi:hypothetical protein
VGGGCRQDFWYDTYQLFMYRMLLTVGRRLYAAADDKAREVQATTAMRSRTDELHAIKSQLEELQQVP